MVYFSNHDVKVDTNITQISLETGIRAEDIISTLQYLDMIKVRIISHHPDKLPFDLSRICSNAF